MCVVSIFPFTRVNQIAIFIIVRAFSALLSFFELSLIHNLSIIVIPSTLSTFLAIVHFTAVPEVIMPILLDHSGKCVVLVFSHNDVRIDIVITVAVNRIIVEVKRKPNFYIGKRKLISFSVHFSILEMSFVRHIVIENMIPIAVHIFSRNLCDFSLEHSGWINK